MSWVIDASSVVDLLSVGPAADATRLVIGSDVLHAPDAITLEVMSAFARRSRAGLRDVEHSVARFTDMPLVRHLSHPLIANAWARRANLRIGDAFYVELARELRLPLVTSDTRLGRAIEQLALCDVHVVTS